MPGKRVLLNKILPSRKIIIVTLMCSNIFKPLKYINYLAMVVSLLRNDCTLVLHNLLASVQILAQSAGLFDFGHKECTI